MLDLLLRHSWNHEEILEDKIYGAIRPRVGGGAVRSRLVTGHADSSFHITLQTCDRWGSLSPMYSRGRWRRHTWTLTRLESGRCRRRYTSVWRDGQYSGHCYREKTLHAVYLFLTSLIYADICSTKCFSYSCWSPSLRAWKGKKSPLFPWFCYPRKTLMACVGQCAQVCRVVSWLRLLRHLHSIYCNQKRHILLMFMRPESALVSPLDTKPNLDSVRFYDKLDGSKRLT